MAAKKNLADAMNKVNAPVTPEPTPVKKVTSTTAPSREGKKAISGFFSPDAAKQIKQIALNEDSTVQALLTEALNDLFIKHNHKPIA